MLSFARVLDAGLTRQYALEAISRSDPERFSGGLAAADYDGDGDVDLYVVGGNEEANHLYRNQGDGTFVEVGADVGLDLMHWGSGPGFGDIDADGDLDLFVGAGEGDAFFLFENRLDDAEAAFVDITASSGLVMTARNTTSTTFFDYDRDGYLDLFFAHWGAERAPGEDTETVWRNNGDNTFSSASIETGIAASLINRGNIDYSFTPNFSNIDGDGDGDLLMTSDVGESAVFLNNDDGTFTNITNRNVIRDQAGMGAAIGDYDNDGDMDWFVTSIYNLDVVTGEHFGNRLYRNDGTGVFSDATDATGVADGGWGWGSCAADFDNDGWLDLFHVNGWIRELGKDFRTDQIRFFHNNRNGTFTERASELGLLDTDQGRGVACFDAERDGDIDIFIVNNSADHLVYYRNQFVNDNHYLGIKLGSPGKNTFAVGARVTVTTATRSQIRDFGGSNNFVSHNPLEIHFGLGADTVADVTVRWPDGTTTRVADVAADQQITVMQPDLTSLRLTVVQGGGDGDYAPGDQIEIDAAIAEEGYFFSHWSSQSDGAPGVFADRHAASTTFTMPPNAVTITAHYLPGVAPAANVSVARRWNEVLLQAIRNDFARPTVHARNLFHLSAAVYDAWAAYAPAAGGSEVPWLFGRSRAGSTCAREDVGLPADLDAARQRALSHAAYRIIRHRFAASPGASRITRDADALMGYLGYDVLDTDTDYSGGSAAALGNHIGACFIAFGLVDGANEQADYGNLEYEPVNPALQPEQPGNPNIVDLNRWQPLALVEFVDQAGNPAFSEPAFLGPEWGAVYPFSLADADLAKYSRGGETYEYRVYHDPGAPPAFDGASSDDYKWTHALVAIWSSHLDPSVGKGAELIDISPGSVGNIAVATYPTTFAAHPDFYDTLNGGDPGTGHPINPKTGEPYAPQLVPRGDYARVLAEFWADGPESETPPGHWFVILNEVNGHEALERRVGGIGPELGVLEWDVKAYFVLGGTMHDVAITAWGIKGWYDYIRPISSIRAMADRGQSSDPGLASYHADGIPLEPGVIELVESGDPLAGTNNEHLDKIKLFAWRGPDPIDDPATDVAGVGWILAENWWPYQRPTFVTPPFAGYVSGHSTYSRAAAEVLTLLTGDAYFPGGMSGFAIPANEFLVFEDGPSVDMTLQWATYRDASDQCSLSRIWGGIHPPADDIPGRLIGIEVGSDAYEYASTYFGGTAIGD